MEKRLVYGCLVVIILATLSSSVAVPNEEKTTNGTTRTRIEMEWSQTFGGSGNDWASSVLQTADGGFIFVGTTTPFAIRVNDYPDYYLGSNDFWLVKTDGTGSMMWNKTYGGNNSDVAASLVQTADGGYALAGSTRSYGAGDYDIWFVKLNANGQHEWNVTYGGPESEWATSLILTIDGGYALIGNTYNWTAGHADYWLVKMDASGQHEWNVTYGGSEWDWVYCLIQTTDGGYVLVGSTSSYGEGAWFVKTDANGQAEWNQTFGRNFDEGVSVLQTVDGGFILTGRTESLGAGNSDFWLVKTDANGQEEWNQTYGGRYTDFATGLIQTAEGGFLLVGNTVSFGAGYTDFWLVKTDATGHHEWNQTFGGKSDEYLGSPRPISPTTDGGLILIGWTWRDFGARGADTWLIKLSEVEIPTTPTTTPPFTTPQVTTPEMTTSQEPDAATAFPNLFSVIGCIGVLIIWRKRGEH